ncbi:unnamed protein product, partial [Allacma fusca]
MLSRQGGSKELPIYSGDPTEWPAYYQQYLDSTRLCGYSNQENFLRLQRSLKGKAKDAVQPLMISSENLPQVLECLTSRFGNSRVIIASMVDKVSKIPVVRDGKYELLIELSNVVRTLRVTMEALKCKGHFNNPTLIDEIVGKLPSHLAMDWAKRCFNKEPDTGMLSDWLSKLANVCSSLVSTKAVHTESRPGKSSTDTKTKETVLTTDVPSPKATKPQGSSVEASNEKIGDGNVIQSCAHCVKRHPKRFCKDKKECNLDGCKRLHHVLLHKSEESPSPAKKAENALVDTPSSSDRRVLLKVLPVTLIGPKGKLKINAILDDCSTVTLLDTDTAGRVGIQGKDISLSLKWLDGKNTSWLDAKQVSFQIESLADSTKFFIKRARA